MEVLKGSFFKVDSKSLFISEPNPTLFGNPKNTNPSVNWLRSRFHFTFAEYRNQNETNFGVLRVMNDDLVQPSRGFDTHPHRDMEIVTFIVSGHLTHKDSMGTEETLNRGAIQFMTAGKGVYHSEFNNHPSEPLRFIQIWITPRKSGLQPNYGSFVPSVDALSSPIWNHLVSDVNSVTKAPVQINQDVNFYVASLKTNETSKFIIEPKRQGYLLLIEGKAQFSETRDDSEDPEQKLIQLKQNDAAEIKGPHTFKVLAQKNSLILLVEMQITRDTRF